jgi:hypothetical protein
MTDIKKTSLSISGYNRYTTCPEYFKLNELNKEGAESTTSALLFGVAVDEGCNSILLKKDDYYEKAKNVFIDFKKSGKPIYFYPDDFDSDLISRSELHDLTESAVKKGFKGKDLVKAIEEILAGQYEASPNQREILKEACLLCLEKKALICLDSYKAVIWKRIKRVISVQKDFSTDIGGTNVKGKIDLIAELLDGTIAVIDNKTTGPAYKADSIQKSHQLHLYCLTEDVTTAGFITISKRLTKNRIKTCSKCNHNGTGLKAKTCDKITNKKRCFGEWIETIQPYSYIQFLFDKVDKKSKDLTIRAMDDVIKCIDNEVSFKNLNSCHNIFGHRCPFFNTCRR